MSGRTLEGGDVDIAFPVVTRVSMRSPLIDELTREIRIQRPRASAGFYVRPSTRRRQDSCRIVGASRSPAEICASRCPGLPYAEPAPSTGWWTMEESAARYVQDNEPPGRRMSRPGGHRAWACGRAPRSAVEALGLGRRGRRRRGWRKGRGG